LEKSFEEWDSEEGDLRDVERLYVGNKDHASMPVRQNFELYMQEQCFHPERPSGRSAYLAVLPEGTIPIHDQHASAMDPAAPTTTPKKRSMFSRENTPGQTPGGTPGGTPRGSVDGTAPDAFMRRVDCNGELAFKEVEHFTFVPAPPRPEQYQASFYLRVIDIEDFICSEEESLEDEKARAVSESDVKSDVKSSNKYPDPPARNPPPVAALSAELPTAELAVVLVVTDVSLYIVYADSVPKDAVFNDAPVPYVYRVHPLHHLRILTIFFGYQRCVLEFRPLPPLPLETRTDDSLCPMSALYASYVSYAKQMQSGAESCVRDHSVKKQYRYLVLTRDKGRLKPIVTQIPKQANITRGVEHMRESRQHLTSMHTITKVRIETLDDQLLDEMHNALYTERVGQGKREIDADILWYQMVYQTWRPRPDVFIARSVILTSQYMILGDEDMRVAKVKLTILDKIKYKDITKIEEGTEAITKQHKSAMKCSKRFDPDLAVTFHMKGPHVYSTARKWRLVCETKKSMVALIEQLRDMCIASGNVLE
jgi:hypothetical protein